MSAGVTPSEYSPHLEKGCVIRTTLLPPACLDLHSYIYRHTQCACPPTSTHTYTYTHAPLTPAQTQINMHVFPLCSQCMGRPASLWHNMDHIRHSLDIEHLDLISATLDIRSMHICPPLAKVWPSSHSKGKRGSSLHPERVSPRFAHSSFLQFVSIHLIFTNPVI